MYLSFFFLKECPSRRGQRRISGSFHGRQHSLGKVAGGRLLGQGVSVGLHRHRHGRERRGQRHRRRVLVDHLHVADGRVADGSVLFFSGFLFVFFLQWKEKIFKQEK